MNHARYSLLSWGFIFCFPVMISCVSSGSSQNETESSDPELTNQQEISENNESYNVDEDSFLSENSEKSTDKGSDQVYQNDPFSEENINFNEDTNFYSENDQTLPPDKTNHPDQVRDYKTNKETMDHNQHENKMGLSSGNHEEINPEQPISSSTLSWIGYDFRQKENQVRIEMITIGAPLFDIRQETNKAGQPELIVQFQNTTLRKKLTKSINSSEFLSPVAYIRSRYLKPSNNTEVILTLRDNVQPSLYSDDGNILLIFNIPEKYQGNFTLSDEPVGQATLLSDADILPVILEGSVRPGSFKRKNSQISHQNLKDADHNQHNTESKNENLQADPDTTQENRIPVSSDNHTIENPYENPLTHNQNNHDNDENNNYDNDENNNYDNDENNNYDNDENENTNGDNFDNDQAFIIKTYHFFNVAQDGPDNNFDIPDDIFLNNETFSNQNIKTPEETSNNIKENPAIKQNNAINNNLNEAKTSNKPTEPMDSAEPKNIDLSGTEIEGSDEASAKTSSQMQPVSMEFKGATLKEVIRAFSIENNVNFIFPEDVGNQKVYLSFNHVPWDQALQAILETHSLGISKLNGNVIRIDSLKTLDQEKKDLEKVRESASRIIPTKVLVVRLSYAKSEDVAKVIKTMLESHSHDKRTKVEADPRTNSVIVEAIPSALSKIKALVTRIDLQTPQVKIDTKIIEVLSNDNLALGINWATPFRSDQSRGLGFGNLAFPNQIYSAFSIDTGINPNSLANRTSADLHLGSINNLFELDIRLRMAEQQNKIKSLQNNSVVVLDNEKAETKVGEIVYNSIPIGNGDNRLSSVEYALMLNVTPHITADGAIQMEIGIEHSSAVPNQTKEVPDKNMRKLETKMLRENGETAVIGGIYRTEYTESYLGVPFLSSIPLLGVLFRSATHSESRRELIVLVTPTVINSDKSLAQTNEATLQTMTGENFQNEADTTNQNPFIAKNINESGNNVSNNTEGEILNQNAQTQNSGQNSSELNLSEDDFLSENGEADTIDTFAENNIPDSETEGNQSQYNAPSNAENTQINTQEDPELEE
ncbi:MAG: hypothetical protein H6618_04170 [Deltaproteobacteria bacterium]|nr:hypothetical protein [Deltaproteobacteria bacterium]